jgi:hypothetical protein
VGFGGAPHEASALPARAGFPLRSNTSGRGPSGALQAARTSVIPPCRGPRFNPADRAGPRNGTHVGFVFEPEPRCRSAGIHYVPVTRASHLPAICWPFQQALPHQTILQHPHSSPSDFLCFSQALRGSRQVRRNRQVRTRFMRGLAVFLRGRDDRDRRRAAARGLG